MLPSAANSYLAIAPPEALGSVVGPVEGGGKSFMNEGDMESFEVVIAIEGPMCFY
jgi:hypothetical protein